ncbi:MAG: hypothetical protein HRU15_00190 [Planctomycetes bacterium]|nr:hypothetical protein [Planctomycetota bacterium]
MSAYERISLQAPLSTIWTSPQPLNNHSHILEVEVLVPANAPSDLGCGAFLADRDMYWYQQIHAQRLTPGRHHLRFHIRDWAAWTAEPDCDVYARQRLAELSRIGLFFFSAEQSTVTLRLHARVIQSPEHGSRQTSALSTVIDELQCDGAVLKNGTRHVQWQTGQRWQMKFLPREMPENPYDEKQFAADMLIKNNEETIRLPAFYMQELRLHDAGDKEFPRAKGAAYFAVRWRPQKSGTYNMQLEIRRGQGTTKIALPEMHVAGTKQDPYVRVDANDPRFLSTGDGDFYWPVGQNIPSVSDDRASERYRMVPTPKRGTLAYAAYFARLGAHGVQSVEVWLSTWNFSLEWTPDRPHYFGLGRYNQFHAAQLDAVLECAWAHGIRLVFNLRNHGQLIRPSAGESEWVHNPYNAANGGPCHSSDRFFDDPKALAFQHSLRRYLVARYADHPGVLTWKLWSEVDLTDAGIKFIRQGRRGIELLTRWHQQAAADWHQLDYYKHPVATHFATDMHNAHPALCALSEIDIILLDAYHHPNNRRWLRSTMGDLMADSLFDTQYGTARFKKPVFVTEYGGALGDHSHNKLAVEHRTGRWQALMAGHAASPMLWWHEWVDQGEHFAPFDALEKFVRGEDLRGTGSRSVELSAKSSSGKMWCRAWARKGLLLIYAQDQKWAETWGEAPPLQQIEIIVGASIAAGALQLESWNADSGALIDSRTIQHAGGQLILRAAKCLGHIAFKLRRL